jgi:integrase
LRERDLGRDLEGAKITLNEYLDRWLETAVKPRVREKTCHDYEGMLRRYIRPNLGERVLAAMRPLDIQATYHQMIERGLSARTVHYTHVVLKLRCGKHCSGVCCLRILWMVSKPRSSLGSKCVR